MGSELSDPRLKFERFLVQENDLCLILSPTQDGEDVVIEALGDVSLLLKEPVATLKWLHQFAEYTGLVRYVQEAIASGRVNVGGRLPRNLYPELGIEYAHALNGARRISMGEFSRMWGYFCDLQNARNITRSIPRHANPIYYPQI